MLTDDGYRQIMQHARRLAQGGRGELAQHLRDAIDLRAEVEALNLERAAAEIVHRETATTVLMQMAEVQRLRDAPQQAEPAAQIGWADEFGNLFPMGAWKPAQRTHHDSHKTAWRAVYLHPPAAPQQAEPVGYFVNDESDDQWHQVDYEQRNGADTYPLYLHPPAAEVQRLRDALTALLDHYVSLVASGDAGKWDAEQEPQVIAARRALGGE